MPIISSKENILPNFMPDFAVVYSSGQQRAAIIWSFKCCVYLQICFFLLLFSTFCKSHVTLEETVLLKMTVAFLCCNFMLCMLCQVMSENNCIYIQKMFFKVQILKLKFLFSMVATTAGLFFTRACAHKFIMLSNQHSVYLHICAA